MSLKKLPKDITVFVDTNIFIYHLYGTGTLKDICSKFFDQTSHKNVKAVTSVAVSVEVVHRAMVQEAAQKLDSRGGKLIQYLKENPEFV